MDFSLFHYKIVLFDYSGSSKKKKQYEQQMNDIFQWELFPTLQLEQFERMMRKLFKQEVIDTVRRSVATFIFRVGYSPVGYLWSEN